MKKPTVLMLAYCSASAVSTDLILSWKALDSAISFKAGEISVALSPSFTMEGYFDGAFGYGIYLPSNAWVTIEGNGATFDAGGHGTFFEVGYGARVGTNASLTLNNITLKNGLVTGSGGAIGVEKGNSLHLTRCTFINNTAGPYTGHGGGAISLSASDNVVLTSCTFIANKAGSGGALYFYNYDKAGSKALLKGCSFVGPISNQTNDIARLNSAAEVTFACADGEVGSPVQMQGNEITTIPPVDLKCTAGKYICHNGGKANWQCVEDPSGISWPDCQEVCAP
jgi:hypothetical protein